MSDSGSTGPNFTFISDKGTKFQAPKGALSIYSPVFEKMVTSPSWMEFHDGYVRIPAVEDSSIQGMVDFICQTGLVWWSKDVKDRATYVVELLSLAQRFTINGLEENVRAKFQTWVYPEDAGSDDGLKRVRDAVDAVCQIRARVQDELWEAMVEKWTEVLNAEHPSGLDEIVKSHPEFAQAVRQEAARRGFQNLKLPSR
ncbi:hypothetical protein M409DRAFT_25468 [Zasmidium cellare ATCC 36951]|uniref:BTB domain-containing protein n=1 Tax=Zasmidium cellare ATCC 36951 TaxID=1080233 RepID=A0A6A6CDX5_ZASCE|nr:uncharacterized protein M409DRAFT_25468 [Zasmidium cellare ATCC 36951]KAF2164122.1 hypothetical protein M409DRAFT_25468 [Zasmidium cellare ATCC 36951]